MKVLLDENLPHPLRHMLPGHEVSTAEYMGWKGVQNGELLAKAAENGFDVLVSKDSGLEFQHNLDALPVAVILLRAQRNSMESILPLVPQLLIALNNLKPRTLMVIPSA